MNMMIDTESTQKALEAAKPFLEKIVNPPLDEIGLLIQDKVRLWRFKQQLKIVNRAKELAEEYNIKIKQVPLKIIAPLLDGASLEEDPDLQEMWAKLLVNYADSEKNLSTSVYPYVISQLSRNEALCLQDNLGNTESLFNIKFLDNGSLKELTYQELINLVRLGVINEVFKTVSGGVSAGEITRSIDSLMDVSNISVFHITALGINFMRACLELD